MTALGHARGQRRITRSETHDPLVREVIAKRIIENAESGEHDVDQLRSAHCRRSAFPVPTDSTLRGMSIPSRTSRNPGLCPRGRQGTARDVICVSCTAPSVPGARRRRARMSDRRRAERFDFVVHPVVTKRGDDPRTRSATRRRADVSLCDRCPRSTRTGPARTDDAAASGAALTVRESARASSATRPAARSSRQCSRRARRKSAHGQELS